MNKYHGLNETPLQDNPLILKKPRSGAHVYGLPVSRELASYLDDVVPDSDQKRLFNMFFAGRFGGTFQMVAEEDDEF